MSKSNRPAIVISAGGMCNGGRVVNWIKANIENPIADILLVGYQAEGTTGRVLQNPKTKKVILNGKTYNLKAKVHTISAYSAHADQQGLINFASRIKTPPKQVILVHGINSSRKELSQKLSLKIPNTRILIPHKSMAAKGYRI